MGRTFNSLGDPLTNANRYKNVSVRFVRGRSYVCVRRVRNRKTANGT